MERGMTERCPWCDEPAMAAMDSHGVPLSTCEDCDESWYTPEHFDEALAAMRKHRTTHDSAVPNTNTPTTE